MASADPNGSAPSPDAAPVPRHVAIIMDGNGRWAEQRGLPRLDGHRTGTENIRPALQSLAESGVAYVTLYAFSTENWGRPEEEVSGLLQILDEVIDDEAAALHQRNVRILHLGSRERLPHDLAQAIERAIALTAGNDGLTLCVGFNYGGRREILEAVRGVVVDARAPEDITEADIAQRLYLPGVPEPDLLIRTGGEQRLSNFLLWQTAYTELYFTPVLWPDFDAAQVALALEHYATRQRRFGRIPASG